MRRWLVLLVPAALALAGCGIGGLLGPQGGPYPDACGDLGFAARQCAAMVTRAETQSGVKAADAISIDILPPTPDSAGLSGGMKSRVRFHLADATERTEEIWCIGVGGGPDDACAASDPIIFIGAGHVDGDVPCTGGGDPPTGCATYPPTPRPDIKAKAKPLSIPVLDIPLDHLGSYRIDLGEAGLPDGAFTNSAAEVANERPDDFWMENARLVIEPVDPARPPIHSIFREPFDGVEQVRVTLVFDVTELDPGAILQVRDILVE